MAPTASIMNPTLRMDDGGAAGAGAGDPAAKKRQKTGTATDKYKVSNNFPRRYPVRVANNETGHTSPLSVLVPSDDDELADGDKKPAAKRTPKKADNDVEETGKETSKPAAKGGSTGAYDSDDDGPDALQYGMQALLDKAEIPGTVASFCMWPQECTAMTMMALAPTPLSLAGSSRASGMRKRR
jgi:hypothetical protein